MLPGASPVGVDKTFEAAGKIRFEGETLMLCGKKVAADPLNGRGMGLLRIVAEACTLLDGHGQVWADHGLEVTEAAHDRAIIPGVGV